MIVPFFFGLGGPIASGKQFLPWIHIEDLIRLIQFAIENENVKGVLNGVAPQVITNAEFTKVIYMYTLHILKILIYIYIYIQLSH